MRERATTRKEREIEKERNEIRQLEIWQRQECTARKEWR